MTLGSSPRSDRLSVILLAVSAVCYGSLVVLIKGAAAAGVNAETGMALRFTLAALVWWALLLARREPLWPGKKRAAQALALGALVEAGNALAFYLGTERVAGSVAAMTFAAVPVTVAVLAWLLLKERLGWIGGLALALAVAGGLMLASEPHPSAPLGAGTQADPVGLLWLGVSIVLCSLYFVLSAPLTRVLPPRVITTYVLTGAALSVLLWGGLTGRIALGFNPGGWVAVAGMALIPSVIGMSTFMTGVRGVGATRSAIVSVFEPLTGVLLAVLFLGDRPSALQIAGGGLVILAAVLVQSPRLRPGQAGRSPVANGPL